MQTFSQRGLISMVTDHRTLVTDLRVKGTDNLAITWYRTERFNLEKKHVKLYVRHVGLKGFLTPYLKDKPVGSELMRFHHKRRMLQVCLCYKQETCARRSRLP